MKLLEGVSCLITGATSGIGLACCRVFTAHGAKVIATGRNEAVLNQLQADGHVQGFVVADLTQPGKCQYVVEQAVGKLGATPYTTLINAAGVLQGGAMGDIGLANFKFNFTNNVQTVFELMEHSIPFLKQAGVQKSPSIINISSVNGKQAFAGCATYCASKAAVDQLTRCASLDLAKYGIRVNAVNPGVVETNLQKRGGMGEEAYAQFLQRSVSVTHPLATALGRVAQPEEVAELCAFLASSKSAFVTGETIAIDGGRQNLGAR